MALTFLDCLKIFATFLFLGGIMRRWIYDRVSNIVFRFILIATILSGVTLFFVGERIMMHAIYLGIVILATSCGMLADIYLDRITTAKAKERNGKK